MKRLDAAFFLSLIGVIGGIVFLFSAPPAKPVLLVEYQEGYFILAPGAYVKIDGIDNVKFQNSLREEIHPPFSEGVKIHYEIGGGENGERNGYFFIVSLRYFPKTTLLSAKAGDDKCPSWVTLYDRCNLKPGSIP